MILMTRRMEFTRATKRQAWRRCNGFCEGVVDVGTDRLRPSYGFTAQRRCDAPLELGCFHYDHIDPEWFSGCNDLSNCQVLCVPCHREKTADDQTNIAKSKRIRDKRSKALTSWRPFRQWRKFDGTIVRR